MQTYLTYSCGQMQISVLFFCTEAATADERSTARSSLTGTSGSAHKYDIAQHVRATAVHVYMSDVVCTERDRSSQKHGIEIQARLHESICGN